MEEFKIFQTKKKKTIMSEYRSPLVEPDVVPEIVEKPKIEQKEQKSGRATFQNKSQQILAYLTFWEFSCKLFEFNFYTKIPILNLDLEMEKNCLCCC